MEPREQVTHFATEIDNLVDRFRKEYDMTFAEMIGVLQLKTHYLCSEAYEDTKEETT